MYKLTPSRTQKMSLVMVTARLAQHEAVEGIVWVGSTGTEQSTDASDYDILLFLSQMPILLHVVFTTIDDVLTDVIFADVDALDRILDSQDLSALSAKDGNVMNWLANGRLQHDRNGRLRQAQARLQNEPYSEAIPETEGVQQWQKVNYNWLQTKRMLKSNDPVYKTAVEVRLQYMVADLWVAYFHVRQMRWDGEKTAVKFWQQHDPTFLSLFQKYIAASTRSDRFKLYEQLAQHTLAPVGGLWAEPATSVSLEHGENGRFQQTALNFWHSLCGLQRDSGEK